MGKSKYILCLIMQEFFGIRVKLDSNIFINTLYLIAADFVIANYIWEGQWLVLPTLRAFEYCGKKRKYWFYPFKDSFNPLLHKYSF